MQIGLRIKGFRLLSAKKLREISGETGLSISFISDVKRGRTLPSLETCQKFANVYGITLVHLLEGIEVETHLTNASRRTWGGRRVDRQKRNTPSR